MEEIKSVQWSSMCPGIIIYLIDNSKKSCALVNRGINNTIQKNFDGDAPKNRCFISVIGYNHNVKELCSGWLKDLDESPIRYETLKKKTPDGAGWLVEVEVKQPVWVEPENSGDLKILDAFHLVKKKVEEWKSKRITIPIIFDLNCGLYDISSQIDLDDLQKQCFVFGVTDSDDLLNKHFTTYSNVPEEWIHRSYRKPLIVNMNGVITSEEMLEIIGQQYVGGQPFFK